MKSVFTFYLRYVILLLGIQLLFSILFLLIYHNLGADAGLWSGFLALAYGLKLDASLTAYILVIPTFLLVIFSIFRKGFLKTAIGIYTFLVVLCLVMAYITNLIIYKYWNFPLDRSIFDYISTPGEMMASLPVWSIVLFFGIIALMIYFLYFWIYRKWVSAPLTTGGKRSFPAAAIFLVVLPALSIPGRGGLATSPIQTGSVYFHQNAFINHAAVNPVWNLFYTLIESDKLTQSVSFYPQSEARRIVDGLYQDGRTGSRVLNTVTPNIILVFLESFAQPVIDELGGNGRAAPNINALVHEGIFFNKFFASGTMTDRSLGAVLAGYPSLPGTCIIYYEGKAQKLSNLNRELKSAGYSSAFLYGGDIDFAHMRSFLVIGGFDHIISDYYFPGSVPRTNWGVPDEYLFQELIRISDRSSEPFFHVMLTLSSHHPFDVPMEPVFEGSDDYTRYENSVYYTDRELGKFIKTAKTRDWWDRTLIVFTADHGCRIKNITAHEQKRFIIPMLWLGGALEVSDTMIVKYGSQTDFPLTLLNQLGLPVDDFKFSKDLFSESSKSFAYYTFNDGIGFLDDSTYTVYSLTTGDYLIREGSLERRTIDPGLAYLQCLLNDFNGK
jgi:phosphoglycerol transferase MdoB-like AlkP superfamily enzyme